jgi:hypothetical protein
VVVAVPEEAVAEAQAREPEVGVAAQGEAQPTRGERWSKRLVEWSSRDRFELWSSRRR